MLPHEAAEHQLINEGDMLRLIQSLQIQPDAELEALLSQARQDGGADKEAFLHKVLTTTSDGDADVDLAELATAIGDFEIQLR